MVIRFDASWESNIFSYFCSLLKVILCTKAVWILLLQFTVKISQIENMTITGRFLYKTDNITDSGHLSPYIWAWGDKLYMLVVNMPVCNSRVCWNCTLVLVLNTWCYNNSYQSQVYKKTCLTQWHAIISNTSVSTYDILLTSISETKTWS